MGLRDLSETWGWIQRIVRRLERIESGAILERSSITDGVMTFIRGTLRLLNGARLELEGILDIVGQVFLKGPMTVSGPNAAITVGGVVITPLGGGRVQIGPNITLDSAEQRLTIGTGDAQIILDLTQFKVGPAFRMDPAHSDTGAQQEFGTNGRTTMYGEDAFVQLSKLDTSGTAVAWVRVGTVDDFTGVQLRGDVSVPNLEQLPAGHGYRMVVRSEEDYQLYTYAGGTGGGPGDGVFAWSFSLELVTSEFGMRQHPVTGEWAMHDGIDFGLGIANIEGTPIPAAGSGTVEVAGVYGGYGNAVVINHGIDPVYDGGGHLIQTLYGHMYQTPDVSVGQNVMLGDTLGGIGQTGQSDGNHLHFEVWVDGVKVNPRTFMAQHGG